MCISSKNVKLLHYRLRRIKPQGKVMLLRLGLRASTKELAFTVLSIREEVGTETGNQRLDGQEGELQVFGWELLCCLLENSFQVPPGRKGKDDLCSLEAARPRHQSWRWMSLILTKDLPGSCYSCCSFPSYHPSAFGKILFKLTRPQRIKRRALSTLDQRLKRGTRVGSSAAYPCLTIVHQWCPSPHCLLWRNREVICFKESGVPYPFTLEQCFSNCRSDPVVGYGINLVSVNQHLFLNEME